MGVNSSSAVVSCLGGDGSRTPTNHYLVSLHDRLLNFFVEISILFISYSCHLILAFLFKLYRLGASLDGSFFVVVSPPSYSCVPP